MSQFPKRNKEYIAKTQDQFPTLNCGKIGRDCKKMKYCV